MSLFDDFSAALSALGSALVSAAAIDTHESSTNTVDDMRAQYIIARAQIAVAESMASFALTQTAQRASEIALAAGHLVDDTKTKLEDAAAAGKQAVVQPVVDAFQAARDLATRAAKAAGVVIQANTDRVLGTLELNAIVILAALGTYIWWQSRKAQPKQRMVLAEA